MEVLRNVSGQTLILQEGGRAIHLLPGRAVTMESESLKSPQLRRLLLRGLVVPEKIGTATSAVTAAKTAEGKRPEKPVRKGEIRDSAE